MSSSSSTPNAGVDRPKGTRLTKLVGIVGAGCAALLCVAVPREESGRTVEARIETPIAAQAPAAVVVTHKAGPQYLKAYRDSVGIWTACDGIAYVKAGSTYTPAQCDAMLEAALAKHAEGVLACTPALAAAGRDYQRAAAITLAYNIGVGAFCATARPPCTAARKTNCSSTGIARKFNAGELVAACEAFIAFRKAGGRVLTGLEHRRHREIETCETGLLFGKTPANLPDRLKRWS